jgi:hypothetical protein
MPMNAPVKTGRKRVNTDMLRKPPPGRTEQKIHRGLILFLLLAGTALAGCSGDLALPPHPTPPACIPGETLFSYRLPFQLEYRTEGEMTFTACLDDLEGTMLLNQDYAFLRAGLPYSGKGKRYAFPESDRVLYTWKISAPNVDAGTCAEQNVSLSLSLSAREGWRELSGGLTAYCGPSAKGLRSFKVMRLSGILEKTDDLHKSVNRTRGR